jgi:NTP pyrophosphatase (non-canonical NTP hydrolase)
MRAGTPAPARRPLTAAARSVVSRSALLRPNARPNARSLPRTASALPAVRSSGVTFDFTAFQVGALSTARYPDRGHNLTYPCLGLCGEAAEIAGKVLIGALDSGHGRGETVKEVGDVLWYVAVLAAEADLDPTAVTAALSVPVDRRQHTALRQRADDAATGVLRLLARTGTVAEIVKKVLRDDGGVLDDTGRARLSSPLSAVLVTLDAVAFSCGANLSQAAAGNAAKLASRAERGQLAGSGDNR